LCAENECGKTKVINISKKPPPIKDYYRLKAAAMFQLFWYLDNK
jgi:hypothetical protein